MASVLEQLQKAYNGIWIAPDTVDGISEAFQFDVVQSDSLTLSSNSTDYLVENGSNIQDNVTLNPITFTVSGLVAELVFKQPKKLKGTNYVQSRFNQLSGIAPQLTTSAQQYLDKANNVANQVQSVVDKANGALDLVSNFFSSDGNTKQVRACARLETLWKARTPFTVRTSWITYKNCIIQNLNFSHSESADASHVSATIKVMNFSIPAVTLKSTIGRRTSQISSLKNLGKDNGKTVNQSQLKRLIGNFGKK